MIEPNGKELARYKIISTAGSVALEAAVNEAMANGWSPLGGVAIDAVGPTGVINGYWIYQAMIKSP